MTETTPTRAVKAARCLLAVGLVLAAWVGRPAIARADNIDEELLKRAPGLMKDLQEHNYKNVGVLKFRVKRGDSPASFHVGLLNANMATRLEYALILVNSDRGPIGITRDASQAAAAQDRTAACSTDAQRQKLFKHNYPLAWGKDRVNVDAFLTGLVKISPDMRKATIIIEAFDTKKTEPREVVNFTVPVDRSILADSSASFSLVRRPISFAKRSVDDLDKEGSESAVERNKGKKSAEKDTLENLVSLDIFYDGQRVDMPANPNEKGERLIAEPQENMKVHFTITNRSNERLAVVIRVNGVNTLHKEGVDKTVDQCMKWVLEPGKTYGIRGFYLEDGETVETFKVVSPQGLPDLDPNKLGLVEMDLFREGGGDAGESGLKTRSLSLRGLDKKQKADTFKDLRAKVRQTMGAQKKPILYAGPVEKGVVKETEFKNPVHTGSMTIRYFQGQAEEKKD